MHEAAGPAARPAQTGGVAPTTPATSAPAPAAQAAPVAPAGQPQNLFQVSTLISFSNGLSSIYV